MAIQRALEAAGVELVRENGDGDGDGGGGEAAENRGMTFVYLTKAQGGP